MSGYISGEAEAEGPPSITELAGGVRALGDVVDLRRLHVHAADQDDVGPGEIGGGRRRMFSSMKRTGQRSGM